MKISAHFIIEEFVPKVIWRKWGARSIWFISPFMVNYSELVRTRFGKPTYMNNWHTGGTLHNRGFRTPTTKVGGKLSQHRFKCAIDLNVKGVSPEEVADDIIRNFSIYKKVGLTTIENPEKTTGTRKGDEYGWTHADCRTTNQCELLIVNP